MRALLFTICMVICSVSSWAADMILNTKESIPAENASYASLSSLTFKFDLSNLDLGEYSTSEVGVRAAMSKKLYLTIFEGSSTEGTPLCTVIKMTYAGQEGFETGGSITIDLDKEYVLSPDQLYTIQIPAKAFRLVPADGTVTILADIPLTEYTFYGRDAKEELLWISQTPSSENPISELDDLLLTFNQSIQLNQNAMASLYEDDNLIKQVNLSLLEENDKIVVADFNNEILYNSHQYTVRIPENSILSNGNGYRKIELNFNGASYKYYSYGRIAPANNSTVSYIGNVTIPLRFENGYNLGRAKAPKAYLYEGEATEPISTFDCGTGDDAKSWTIPVWNFELKPSTEYRVVIPAEQVSPWETTDTGGLREVKDTTNPELVLNYTTPAVIEPLPRQSFKSVTPDVTEPIENLTSLRVDFEPYFFEDVFYYPVFPTTLTEGYNLVKFVDVTTGDESSFPVEIKWDDANNYWLENSAEINYTLLKDHDYQVVIPAGMFRCRLAELGDNSANEEYAINFKGATRTEFDVTFILAEVGSMKSIVAAGKTVTVDLEGTEDWKVSAVIFNGEAVETEGSTYTTPAIEDDATVEVEYEYAREIDYNFTTGVDMTEICPYGVVSEGENLIITGVQPGDAIAIYTTGGLKVADLPTVPQNMDRVAVSLPTGQAYIILINGKSLKFLHQ